MANEISSFDTSLPNSAEKVKNSRAFCERNAISIQHGQLYQIATLEDGAFVSCNAKIVKRTLVYLRNIYTFGTESMTKIRTILYFCVDYLN